MWRCRCPFGGVARCEPVGDRRRRHDADDHDCAEPDTDAAPADTHTDAAPADTHTDAGPAAADDDPAGVTVASQVLVGGLSPADATTAVKEFFARPLLLKVGSGGSA